MKNKRSPGGLFGLLARSYLLFTLTLLVIIAGVFILWGIYIAQVYAPMNWESLLQDPALAAGDFSALEGHLGKSGSSFAVYDQRGRLTYASADDFDPQLSPGELDCISPYGRIVEVTSYTQNAQNGLRRLVIRQDYDLEEPQMLVLDADYQVVFGDLGDGRTGYTAAEYRYLTQSRFGSDSLQRYDFVGSDGQPRTMLLREKALTDADYLARYQQSQRVWLLCLPLYLADAGLFIWWLRRRIARPLQRINLALEGQATGRPVRVGSCSGPREIRRIGESLDRLSAQLAESEARRQQLDQGRQKLIADISHDLKTPITVISGYIDAICDGKVPPEGTDRYLRAIQQKVNTLAQLTSSFHEYSKVEHPAFVLHPRRTDLCEFLREYLAAKYDEIDLAGFSLEPDIPDAPLFCMLDELQLRRVLDNLLSNALRHNRLGTLLFVQLEKEGANALLRVADNGEGIPPERRQSIFEPFVVGSDARSGSGSGLGLAITRRIVEKHGGSIRLENRPAPGRTTEFVILLPLCP